MERTRIGVVTDGAANVPLEVARDLGIEVVPMYLSLGGRTYRDTDDVEGFYERLREDPGRPTTSTPAPGDFVEAFRRTGAEEIVCVTVAASVSGTYGAARVGAELAAARVEVVDSGNASMAEGFCAIEAARAAHREGTLVAAATRAAEVASRARLVATVDTFEFLQRSGRVNRWVSFAGTALRMKPVFMLAEGRVRAIGRPRTRRRAIERVAARALEEIGDRPVHLAAVHAAAEDEAAELLRRVSDRVRVLESHVASFTPVMGAHTGPGVVGLAFFPD